MQFYQRSTEGADSKTESENSILQHYSSFQNVTNSDMQHNTKIVLVKTIIIPQNISIKNSPTATKGAKISFTFKITTSEYLLQSRKIKMFI